MPGGPLEDVYGDEHGAESRDRHRGPTTISSFLAQPFKSYAAECLRRDLTPGQGAIFAHGLAPLAADSKSRITYSYSSVS